jgi:hypothetical protein
MTSKPSIPNLPWADSLAAQTQRITGQTTQSLGAYGYARQSNSLAATPPQQSPLQNVGRPVEYINISCSRIVLFLCIAGTVKMVEHSSPAITTYLRGVRQGCIPLRNFFCALGNRIEGSLIRESVLSVTKLQQGVPSPTGVRTPYPRSPPTASQLLRTTGL